MVKKKSSSVYNINYHLVFCPKYRKTILGNRVNFLRETIETICLTKNWEILELQIMPNHIHLFISTSPFDSPTSIVKILKGISALKLFKKFPNLRNILRKGSFWSSSYYVGTAGNVSAETIKKYIENQKGNSSTE